MVEVRYGTGTHPGQGLGHIIQTNAETIGADSYCTWKEWWSTRCTDLIDN